MKASRRGIDEALLAEPRQCGVDVMRAHLGIGLRRPVAAAHILEAARGEAVDDQRDVTPRRAEGPPCARCSDRDRRSHGRSRRPARRPLRPDGRAARQAAACGRPARAAQRTFCCASTARADTTSASRQITSDDGLLIKDTAPSPLDEETNARSPLRNILFPADVPESFAIHSVTAANVRPACARNLLHKTYLLLLPFYAQHEHRSGCWARRVGNAAAGNGRARILSFGGHDCAFRRREISLAG